MTKKELVTQPPTLEEFQEQILAQVRTLMAQEQPAIEQLRTSLASLEARVESKTFKPSPSSLKTVKSASPPPDQPLEIKVLLTSPAYAEHRNAIRAKLFKDLQARLSPLLVQGIAFELEAQMRDTPA